MTLKEIKTTLSKQKKFIFFTNAKGERQSANANFSNLPEEIFGQEVDAYQDGNKLVKVIWKGEVYSPITHSGNDNNSSKQEDNRQTHHQHGKNRQYDNRPNKGQNYNTNGDYARAPYNFIPQPLLSAPVTLPETKPERLKAFDRYLPDLLSGSITFDLETLTHAFFGGQHKDTKKTFILNGRAVIPAASLRGMLRAAVAIVSHGKFGPVDKDRRFFYRHNPQKNGMLEFRTRAGILKYENHEFCIYESKFSRFNGLKSKKYGDCGIDKGIEFGRWIDENGYIVQARSVNKNKQATWHIERPNWQDKPIVLKEEDIKTFDYDFEIRSSSFSSKNDTYMNYMNLTKCAKDGKVYKDGVPIFFLQIGDDDGKDLRTFIGNTKGFRIPYSQTMGDLVKKTFHPGCKEQDAHLDFAEGLLGTLEGPGNKPIRGRIRIENAYGPNETALEDPQNLSILLSPKPSAYQLYLEQPKGIQTLPKTTQTTYENPMGRLRGRKLYHHRIFNNESPRYFTDKRNDMQDDLNGIRTIKPKSCFNAKMHFMNLLPEELGALLWVLDLPEGYAHKLGMGKPLGLGSMKTENIQLNICNTKYLYADVFKDSGELALPKVNTLEPTSKEFIGYKSAFEEYMLTALNRLGDRCQNLWEAKNMQYYAAMLDTKGKDEPGWLDETCYMGGVFNSKTKDKDTEAWENKYVLPHALFTNNPNKEKKELNPNDFAKNS